MRSKRLHSVLAQSRMQTTAKHSRIQQQQALIDQKLNNAHVLLEHDDTAHQLKMLMSAHVRNSLGRSRQLDLQVKKSQADILKAAQLEAGAKRRRQRELAEARKRKDKKQLAEIIDTYAGKPPASQY